MQYKNSPRFEIQYRDPKLLKANPNNPREHSERQNRKLRGSIRTFGFIQPLLIDNENQLICGNARLSAALELGIPEVPCLKVTHLDDAETRAFIIAENRISELGEWNPEILAREFQFLNEANIDFELEITGFSTSEIDLMLCSDEDLEEVEDLEPDFECSPQTKAGDLWLCGLHRIFCGDAKLEESYAKLLGAQRADMVFTDPPYNVPIRGHVRSNNSPHREFMEASGELSSEAFEAFLEKFISNVSSYSRDGALHYICMDWRHIGELLKAGRTVYSELVNLCIWNKSNGGMGSFYRSKHELIFVWKHGSGKHLNNVQLGANGRYRTNVWDYAGVNSFSSDRAQSLENHPTVKPVKLVEDAILDCTKLRDCILDPFLGSGTTLIAAERAGRIACGIEVDPSYVDVALRRWQSLTGVTPINSETGDDWIDRTKSNASETV